MYRDDLEAALARNASLERRIAELEGARTAAAAPTPAPRATTMSGVAAPPPAPRRVAPPPRAGGLAFVRPATWLPLSSHLAHSVGCRRRALAANVPRWHVPPWSSPVAIVHLLARASAWLAACLAPIGSMLALVAVLVWTIPALAIAGVGFVVGSVALLPIIALASVRRHDGAREPTGVSWGRERPGRDDPDQLLLMTLLGVSCLTMPVTMLLFAAA